MDAIVGLFPQLLPQLLKRMVYPLEMIKELMEENRLDKQNGRMENRDHDIAPAFHKSCTKGQGNDHCGARSKDSDNDKDEDNEDDNMDDNNNEWMLCKCAAASLDALAGLFGASNTLPSLLPALQESLRHDDQWVCEANILALGAIANGCKAELTPHLPVLHPFILRQMTAAESMPQLRCIAALTLARYASWTVNQLEMRNSRGGGGRLWWGRSPRRSRCACWTCTRWSRSHCVLPWGSLLRWRGII
jgi:transportin-1